MRKIVQKMSMLLSMIVMMMVVFQMPVKAAPAEDMTIIYTQVPQDWKEPCIWAWDEDGNNAFEAWPGETMKADSSNEGWYYAWVPSWANHVIINGNEGNIQTEEQILEDKNTWITVASEKEVAISYEQQTTGEIPEYVETFTVHAKVADSWKEPNLWAWSAPDGTNVYDAWPGEPMTEGEDGWYDMEVPTWVNSLIVNANNGEVQTEDLSVDAAEIWITVEENGSFDFTYDDPEQKEIGTIKVRVMAPTDWKEPNLWAWSAPDGTNVFSTWPGEPLEEDKNGWLKKEIPGWVNSLIVNGNDGSVQTSDISIETGKDVWLVVKGPEEAEVYYEEPQVEQQKAETKVENKKNDETTEKKNDMTIVWIIVAVAAVAVVVTGIVIVKKKKEN
ncbi:MAG: starch-binding protein [Clostridiales bacterium]|nr:starch-binding protein [Clostridiales bacterium]